MALRLIHLQTIRGLALALDADEIESVEAEGPDSALVTMKSGTLHSVKTGANTIIKNWIASQGPALS